VLCRFYGLSFRSFPFLLFAWVCIVSLRVSFGGGRFGDGWVGGEWECWLRAAIISLLGFLAVSGSFRFLESRRLWVCACLASFFFFTFWLFCGFPFAPFFFFPALIGFRRGPGAVGMVHTFCRNWDFFSGGSLGGIFARYRVSDGGRGREEVVRWGAYSGGLYLTFFFFFLPFFLYFRVCVDCTISIPMRDFFFLLFFIFISSCMLYLFFFFLSPFLSDHMEAFFFFYFFFLGAHIEDYGLRAVRWLVGTEDLQAKSTVNIFYFFIWIQTFTDDHSSKSVLLANAPHARDWVPATVLPP